MQRKPMGSMFLFKKGDKGAVEQIKILEIGQSLGYLSNKI